MKSCLVLMCTYNGERYLREQLDSILAQRDVAVSIKIADDRSTDSTVELLREYAQKYPNIEYSVNEKNKRFTYNFLDMLFSVKDTEYDFYAFSDQDDVWLPEKLSRAIGKLEERSDSPHGVLYCSNLIVTDEKLNQIRMMENDGSVLNCNKNTVACQNIATGCTVVFDRSFLAQCTKHYPTGITLHDYWVLLIAAFTANYIYDYNGYIYYRQHSSNQIGSNGGGAERWYSLLPCIEAFLTLFGEEIGEKDRKILETVKNYRKNFFCKCKLLFSRRFTRYRGLSRLGFCKYVLQNRI